MGRLSLGYKAAMRTMEQQEINIINIFQVLQNFDDLQQFIKD